MATHRSGGLGRRSVQSRHHVSHMTVGNEEYGSWEVDHHSSPHNGATYAAAVAGPSGYYALIKAASPHTLVGVSVAPGSGPWIRCHVRRSL